MRISTRDLAKIIAARNDRLGPNAWTSHEKCSQATESLGSDSHKMIVADEEPRTHYTLDAHTSRLFQILKKARDETGRQWKVAIARNPSLGQHDMAITMSDVMQRDIRELLAQEPDVTALDNEGYNMLAEINYWKQRGVFSEQDVTQAIHCHNRRYGLESYDPNSKISSQIRLAIYELNAKELRKLLKANPYESKALNYIYSPPHHCEGNTLINSVMANLEMNSKDYAKHQAAMAVLDVLLKSGANPNIPIVLHDEGRTCLHYAVLYGNPDCLEKLVQYGGNINQRGCASRVDALLYLCMMTPDKKKDAENRLACARFLLDRGASPDQRSASGPWSWRTNALETVRERGDTAMVHLIENFCSSACLSMRPGG